MDKISLSELLEAKKRISKCPAQPIKLIGTTAYFEKVLQLSQEQIASGRAYGREIVILEGKAKPQWKKKKNSHKKR